MSGSCFQPKNSSGDDDRQHDQCPGLNNSMVRLLHSVG